MSDISFLQRFRVTEEEAYDAFNLVRNELWQRGRGVLWQGSKLEKIDLRYHRHGYGSRSVARGVGDIAKDLIGDLKKRLQGKNGKKTTTEGYWWNGYIHIPRSGFWIVRQASIEDVFRHEFGHALADLYPETLKKGGTFRKAFGRTYGEAPAEERGVDGWEERYVSEYATSATQEDFAETFMLFVKHKGKIPAKFAEKPAIKKKWEAVAEICRRVAACTE